MKIGGKKIEGINTEICVIPRGEGPPIVFTCKAVLDMKPFEKLCPLPKPPVVIKPGGKKYEDVESPSYKAQLETNAKQRMSYMILKSLEATEGLEWETVKLSDPSTWDNYTKELEDSGFSQIEVMRIVNTAAAANCLDENRLEQARKDFLAGLLVSANGQSSHKEDQPSIQSGEPVSD
jgi:hypothetical protein